MPDTSPPAPRLLRSVPSSSPLEATRARGWTRGRSAGRRERGPWEGPPYRPASAQARMARASMAGVRVVAAPDKLRGTASAAGGRQGDRRRRLRAGLGLRRGPDGRRRRGHARRARGRQPHDHRHRPARRPGRGRAGGSTGAPRSSRWPRASGLELAGGAEANDPVAASTVGTGELIVAALDAGARPGRSSALGGSATTDGGLARSARPAPARPAEGRRAGRGLRRPRAVPRRGRRCSPRRRAPPPPRSSCCAAGSSAWPRCTWTSTASTSSTLEGAGAAGGLGGGLAAAGGRLVTGSTSSPRRSSLDERLEGADLVITGEGFLDEQSFEGKVVGGVAALAERLGVPVVAIAGEVYDAAAATASTRCSLVERFGEERARTDTLACITQVATDILRSAGHDRPMRAAPPPAGTSGTLDPMVERIRRAGRWLGRRRPGGGDRAARPDRLRRSG